ncbi:Uncharacterised protein [Mycobacteroides abscessus subsp. abscessus]|nr:Uncharacterised protein [Mycobacteroides abscessus subsp. abscessus]
MAKKPSSCSAKYCTMSLRSGSPCTSTSRPSFSCSAMTSATSARICRTYSTSSISPLVRAWRALRISTVCGKDPMVVVGRAGSRRRSSCLRRRSAASPRETPSARTASKRVRIWPLFRRGSVLRDSAAALDAAISAATASRPSPRARASTTTSLTFSSAKASQLRSWSSSSVSGSSE